MKQSAAQQTDPDDEALCAQVAVGSRIAEELLAQRYSRLVRICARPYFLAGGDSEDLIQEGMIGLLRAMRAFTDDRGASFRTYAETCIRSRIVSAVRAATRDKHLPLNQSISLETPLLGDSVSASPLPLQENPEDLLIGREEQRARLSALTGQLSSLESKVLQCYLGGFSYDEIALQVGRSPKAIDNAVQRIRRKLARHITFGDFSAS